MMDIKTMKAEVQECLQDNILHFWQTKMVDRENGGFYGRIDGQEVLHPDAEKGAILNARILWTFSAAYRVLGKQEYLDMATYAKDYFIDHFIDKEYGGVYWSLDYKGQPLNTRKQFYAIGFALYGLQPRSHIFLPGIIYRLLTPFSFLLTPFSFLLPPYLSSRGSLA